MTTNVITPYLIDIDEDFEELLNTMVLVAGYYKRVQREKQLKETAIATLKSEEFSATVINPSFVNMKTLELQVKELYKKLSELYPNNTTFRNINTGRFTSHRLIMEMIGNDISQGKALSANIYRALKAPPTDNPEAKGLITEYALRYKFLSVTQKKYISAEKTYEYHKSRLMPLTETVNKIKGELKIIERDLKRMRSAAALRIIRMIEKETRR